MPSTAMVHVRINEELKKNAAAELAKMGMSVSDAVRLMLVRVAAEKALPFEVRVPNMATMKAMQAADRKEGARFNSAEAALEELGI